MDHLSQQILDPLTGRVFAPDLPQLQILYAVVVTNSVLVVHSLIGHEVAPDVLFHDDAVLEDVPLAGSERMRGQIEPNVTVRVYVAAAFPVRGASCVLVLLRAVAAAKRGRLLVGPEQSAARWTVTVQQNSARAHLQTKNPIGPVIPRQDDVAAIRRDRKAGRDVDISQQHSSSVDARVYVEDHSFAGYP